MTAAVWFWLFFAFGVVLRGIFYAPEQRTFRYIGGDLFIYVLIFILGYHAFGSFLR